MRNRSMALVVRDEKILMVQALRARQSVFMVTWLSGSG